MRPLFALFLALFSPLALAADGAEILAKVDHAISNFDDSNILFEVINMKPGTSEPQTMRFRALVRSGKTYTEFLEPGDMKGTRALTTSATQMWVYLPEFGKIRKVASHNLSGGFMGTTLSQQDMGTTAYGNDYDAALASEDETTYTLDLTAKDPKSVAYPKMTMVVEKKRHLPLEIRYLSEDGTVTRTQTRGEYTCPKPDYCMFGEMKMVDHTRDGAWTILKPLEVDIDTGIEERIFSPRTLMTGI